MGILAKRTLVGWNEGQCTKLVQVEFPLGDGQIWKSLIWTTEIYPNYSHQGVLFDKWSESSLVNGWDRVGPQEHCAQQGNLFCLSQVQDMVLGS